MTAGPVEVVDVAGVEQVEATVREADGLALAAPALHRLFDGADLPDLLAERDSRVLLTTTERIEQLGLGDGNGSGLADDDPGGEVRECRRVTTVEPDRDGRGERCDCRVAGAGHVEHLARPRAHGARRRSPRW